MDNKEIDSNGAVYKLVIAFLLVLLFLFYCLIQRGEEITQDLRTELEEYKEEYSYTEADLERSYEDGYTDAEYTFFDIRYEDGYNDALKDVSISLGKFKSYGYLLGYYDGYNAYSYRTTSSVKSLVDTGLYHQSEYDKGFYDGYDNRQLNITRDVNMPMVHVTSSFINSVGYISDIPVLVICMNEDDWYGYTGVSQSVFMDLIKAASPGTYFNENIKNHYDYKKIR